MEKFAFEGVMLCGLGVAQCLNAGALYLRWREKGEMMDSLMALGNIVTTLLLVGVGVRIGV